MASANLGYRSVLRNRQFRYFLASSTSSLVGYAVYEISVVWLTFSVSHDFFAVGAILFIEYAVYTFTFLVGPIVDRARNQRTIFVVCYPVQAAAAAVLGISYFDGFLTLPLLFGLVVLISVLWDLAWASSNAVPALLLTQEEQFAAQGISGAVGGANTIAGYAAGGVLILLVGAGLGMILYAILLGLAALFAVPLRVGPGPTTAESFAHSFTEGWKVVTAGVGRPLLQLALVDSIQGFFVAVPGVLITLTAASTFHASAVSYGVLFTSFIVGGVVSGLLLGRWNPRHRVGVVLVGALLATSLAFAIAAGAPAILSISAGAWFAIGFAWAAFSNSKFVFLRGAVAGEKMGRVFANMYVLPGVAGSAGALVLGAVAGFVSPAELAFLGAGGFLLAGLVASALPAVRRLQY